MAPIIAEVIAHGVEAHDGTQMLGRLYRHRMYWEVMGDENMMGQPWRTHLRDLP
jgi:hypothetical protein